MAKRKGRKKKKGSGKRRKRIDFSKIKWGTLTKWLYKHRRAIKRKYGDPFTKTGELNDNVLRRLYHDEAFLKRLSKNKWKKIKKKIHFKLYVLKG